jgi:hypothetical protein
MHERRLARPGRPDDGHELALVDAQRNSAQRVDGHAVELVAPGQADRFERRSRVHGSS